MKQNDRSREKTSIGSMFSLVLSARHDPVARILNVDLVAVLVAALLPWSTSGVAIVMVVWLVALVYTLEVRPFLASLRPPAFMLPIPVIVLRDRKTGQALLWIAIAVTLIVNMPFVVVSRTALVTMRVMLAVFALMHLKWRTNVILFAGTVVLAALAWMASPQLQATTEKFTRDYRIYKELNQPTSIGVRLEFYRKSLHFFAEAPLIGHGTGSTRGLFEAAATGPAVLAAGQVIGNPHNQTLNVAVQWGSIGVVILYAMWR